MKKIAIILFVLVLAAACGNEASEGGEKNLSPSELAKQAPKADDGKGVGPTTEVSLNSPLNQEMVEKGRSIYEMKCAACHKLTDQRVVGPGWKGLTEKRKPEWIMNMTTNVEAMLEEDPAARELLKECLVRMPNQNLSIADARDVLEFIYFNDGYE